MFLEGVDMSSTANGKGEGLTETGVSDNSVLEGVGIKVCDVN